MVKDKTDKTVVKIINGHGSPITYQEFLKLYDTMYNVLSIRENLGRAFDKKLLGRNFLERLNGGNSPYLKYEYFITDLGKKWLKREKKIIEF